MLLADLIPGRPNGPISVEPRPADPTFGDEVRKYDRDVMDALRRIASLNPDEARARLQIGTTPMLVRPVHLLLRRTLAGAAAIIDGFNAQIRTMIADRTYHRLLHVSWIYAEHFRPHIRARRGVLLE